MVNLEAKAKALMDLFVSVARTNGACDDDIAEDLLGECGFTSNDIIQCGHEELVKAYIAMLEKIGSLPAEEPDEFDRIMIERAQSATDNTLTPLSELNKEYI